MYLRDLKLSWWKRGLLYNIFTLDVDGLPPFDLFLRKDVAFEVKQGLEVSWGDWLVLGKVVEEEVVFDPGIVEQNLGPLETWYIFHRWLRRQVPDIVNYLE